MAFINPFSELSAFNTDGTTILQGCAVLNKTGFTSGAQNIGHVTGADSWFLGVTEYDALVSDYVQVVQIGQGACKLRLASNVLQGDRLNVANSIGEFQTAPVGASNIAYVALSNGTAGTNTTWGMPIIVVPSVPASNLLQTSEGRVTTNITTTSATLSDMTGALATITTSAGSKILVTASYSTSTASVLGATTTVVLDIDGSTDEGSASSFTLLANSTQGGAFTRLKTGLTAGSHTFKLRWATSTSTAQCRPVSNPTTEHATITVMEVRV